MVFQIYGNILSSRIMTDKEAKKSKGYGFISYDNPTSAMQAMQNMNGYQANSSSKLINIREETESVDKEGRRWWSDGHGVKFQSILINIIMFILSFLMFMISKYFIITLFTYWIIWKTSNSSVSVPQNIYSRTSATTPPKYLFINTLVQNRTTVCASSHSNKINGPEFPGTIILANHLWSLALHSRQLFNDFHCSLRKGVSLEIGLLVFVGMAIRCFRSWWLL